MLKSLLLFRLHPGKCCKCGKVVLELLVATHWHVLYCFGTYPHHMCNFPIALECMPTRLKLCLNHTCFIIQWISESLTNSTHITVGIYYFVCINIFLVLMRNFFLQLGESICTLLKEIRIMFDLNQGLRIQSSLTMNTHTHDTYSTNKLILKLWQRR